MPFTYEDAVRQNIWLRMMLLGPTGAGKTKGALEVATNLYDGQLPVGLIDTEHGRSKLYADRYKFKRGDLNDHAPERWIEAMHRFASDFTGGALIFDSATHEWNGTNGILQAADKFGDWKVVRPRHTAFVEALLSLPMHVIVCVRAKMKYSVDEYDDGNRKRQRVTALGIGPIQDDNFPYEFDVVGTVDRGTHETTFTGRDHPLMDQTVELVPGKEVADALTGWLSEGEALPAPDKAEDAKVEELRASLEAEGMDAERIEAGFRAARAGNQGELSPAFVAENLKKSKARLKAKERNTEPAAA